MRLQNLYGFGLKTLGALHDVELHGLAFLKALEAVRLDRREMNEYVFAILTADKAKSLCIVKPLHCSLFHFVCTCFLFYFCTEKIGCCLERVARMVVGGTSSKSLRSKLSQMNIGCGQ